MRIVAIVQARIRSTRLPAKVLLDLAGVTALERCLTRVARIRHVGKVVVATPDGPEDDLIETTANRLGFESVRGSESDVLDRYLHAARAHDAEAIVRITSDCPFIDPEQSSLVVDSFLRERPDYACNVLVRRLPRGLDTEILTREALESAGRTASDASEREHVTLHIRNHPERFRILSVAPHAEDHSNQRWTLDTLEDYRFLHRLAHLLGGRAADADMERILDVLRAHPNLTSINSHIEQKQP